MKRRIQNLLFKSINCIPGISHTLDSVCVDFHRLNENFNYDYNSNGEKWLLEQLARQKLLSFCFDVGANHGDWTAMILANNPGATVHCFEICPETYRKLAARFPADKRVVLNSAGLSDQAGDIEVQYCLDSDGLSSMFEVVCSTNIRKTAAKVIRGGDYCKERGIGKIDFLKMDVEGAEHLVLNGFGELLRPHCVPVIQFEYGMVNIATKFLLRDFHALLEARGYKVGKLFPDHVRFREYRFQDEDFLGPNYIAAAPELAVKLG